MTLTAQVLVERSLAAFGDRIAIDDEGTLIPYRTLADRSARLANLFLALGAGPVRPVAVYLGNSFHFVECDLACMRAGVLRVGISSRLTADECQFIINHSRAAILVTTRAMIDRLDRSDIGELEKILLIDADVGPESYEASIASASASLAVTGVAPQDAAYVLYTSGTTGRPKGALHTHGSRVAAVTNMLANELVIDHNSGMVHCGALTHGSGSKVLSFLARGARNIILPKFEPAMLADAVKNRGGTHSFVVPTMLQMIEEAGPLVTGTIRGMEQISFGGAPISNVAFGRAVAAFGANLVQVYGTSEAPHPLTVLRPDDYAAASDPGVYGETAGRATTGIEVAVMDDAGQILGYGTEGECVVRGPSTMQCYLHNPEATDEVIDKAGWYHTGDVAEIDAAGFVRFRDRKRDLIISGGLNVYPSEVERVLAEHDDVREVAVVGVPDDRWGEAVMAFVVLREGSMANEAAITKWIDGRIAGYKKPRRVAFLDELPKGSTNKVLKRVLRNSLWHGQDRSIN